MQRLRPLTENECYLRCYGWRGSEETVRVLRSEDVPVRDSPGGVAERIRAAFEALIDDTSEAA